MRAACLPLVLCIVLISAGSGLAQGLPLDFTVLQLENMRVIGDDLTIDLIESRAGDWYRYPPGNDVFEIQLEKEDYEYFSATAGCLPYFQQPWSDSELYPFLDILYRVGPISAGVSVATLESGVTLELPDFAAGAPSLKFVTHGAVTAVADYTVSLEYLFGETENIVVPVLDSTVPVRDGSAADYRSRAVADFSSDLCGNYGDVIEIFNPRPYDSLGSVTIYYPSGDIEGPIALSVALSESDFESGFVYTGRAQSGDDQAAALHAGTDPVRWTGLSWSATFAGDGCAIECRVHFGDAGAYGTILWLGGEDVTITDGAGSVVFDQPTLGEFVMVEIDMTAGLDEFHGPQLHGLTFQYEDVTAVASPDMGRFALLGAAPNPFNPRTTISFELPDESTVDLRVYDASGRLVRTLLSGEMLSVGCQGVVWDGRDAMGRTAPSGVYFYRLEAGRDSDLGRMLLLR